MSCAHGRQELPCNSWVGKFLQNSGQCLNVKRQVGVLLWGHRGWILRIASLIKIERQHNPSFLLIHIVDSTFHQPQAGPPLSPERETCCMLFHVLTMWSQLFIRQTIRPEACGASFQTIRTQNICMLSYALTYKYELALMVGASLGSQVGKNPFRILESAP